VDALRGRGINVKIKGKVQLRLFQKDNLIWTYEGANLVTTVGKTTFAQRINGDGPLPARPSYVAVGTDGTAVAESQTALLAESVVIARTALVGVRTNNVLTYAATIVAGVSAVAVKEMGLFDLNAAGIMYARFLPQAFTFSPGMTLGLSWYLTVG
jgi:hypothetical protein